MPDSIDIGDVVFSYGAAPVLRGVSLAVSRGEIVLIGGRSGHGTSTLLEIIVGLLRPQSGRVRWDGADLASMDNATLLKSRQSIGYVFQGNALISSFTVFDNIALPLRNMPGMKAEEVRARVRAGMETMALFNIDTKFPESLSSGQSKMVAITRALVGNPEMLILDKPFSGVDDQAAAGIIAIIEERWKQTGMGIIMVTNALTLWPDYPVRRFVLDAGKLISYQSPDQARQAVTGKEPRKP